MTSPVDIVNIALTEIGARETVQRINPSDGSAAANAASVLYTPKIQALIRAAHWNCARKQAALTQLKAAIIDGEVSDDPPPVPWLYEYAYPSDCLACRFILPMWNLPNNSVPFTTAENIVPYIMTGPPVKYVVSTDIVEEKIRRVILTNMPQAVMVYTKDISQEPDLWDTHFMAAATSTLGAWLVNPLNRNRSLLMDQTNVAKAIILQARLTDGNEGLTSADHLPDWMQIRATGAGWGIDGGIYYQGWDAIGFPGGFAF